jgi:hypothetical protein
MPSMMTAPGSFRAKKVGRGSERECGMATQTLLFSIAMDHPRGEGGGGGGALFRRRVSSAYYTRYHIHVVYLEAF